MSTNKKFTEYRILSQSECDAYLKSLELSMQIHPVKFDNTFKILNVEKNARPKKGEIKP